MTKSMSGVPFCLRHYYYNSDWQVIEERVGGPTGRVDAQYVWHPHYVDALAVRYRDANQSSSDGLEQVHYYLQDANYNVTALVNGKTGDANLGKVVERYAYTPYGTPTILNGASGADADGAVAEWSVDTYQGAGDVGNVVLYTGREYDWETGLQLNRNRFYASHLGRWLTRDPNGETGRMGMTIPSDAGMAKDFVDRDGFDRMAEYDDGNLTSVKPGECGPADGASAYDCEPITDRCPSMYSGLPKTIGYKCTPCTYKIPDGCTGTVDCSSGIPVISMRCSFTGWLATLRPNGSGCIKAPNKDWPAPPPGNPISIGL